MSKHHRQDDTDAYAAQVLMGLDERITKLERKVFGDEIDSKIQGRRQVMDELIQINAQLHRSLTNRESIQNLMKLVEEILDLIRIEDTSSTTDLLGCENKANAILLAEPIIKEMYAYVKNINTDEVNEAINSKDIRDIIPLKEGLVQLKAKQLEELDSPSMISTKIQALTEAIDILILNSTL